jgi:hypothetical protein
MRKPIEIAYQAMAFHRLQVLAVLRLGPAGDAQHHRLRRTVDVGVQDADRGSFGQQCEGEIDRRRRFADALAGGDGDDVLDAGDQLHPALHSVRHDFGAHRDACTRRVGRFQRVDDLAPDEFKLALAR